MKPLYYILDENHNVVVEPDVHKWAKQFEDIGARIVKKTNLADCQVSTVFLAIDHSFLDDQQPVLFETMVFGGEYDGEQFRYHTWDEAVEGHKKTVEKCK